MIDSSEKVVIFNLCLTEILNVKIFIYFILLFVCSGFKRRQKHSVFFGIANQTVFTKKSENSPIKAESKRCKN